jgi:hypothetical protein
MNGIRVVSLAHVFRGLLQAVADNPASGSVTVTPRK